MWDRHRGILVTTLDAHIALCSAVLFNPVDGNMFVSMSASAWSVKLWHIPNM